MPIRFQVDGDFYDHPKTLGISDAAVALWTRAGSYCAAKLLDGFVPENALAVLSRTPEEASAELVHCGLWRRVKGGFRFHQWDERNLTKARVQADREYDRAKKRRQRAQIRTENKVIHNHDHDPTDAPVDNGPTTQEHQANPRNVPPGHARDSPGTPEGIPPVSVSVSESVSVSGSGRPPGPPPTAGPERVPEPPTRCPRHLDDPDPPPCGPCADARRAHGRWEAQRAARESAMPKCRKHRGQPAHNCAPCRAEKLAGGIT